MLAACSSTLSPRHIYDDRADADRAAAVKALDQRTTECFKKPDRACRDDVVGALKWYIDEDWRRFRSEFFGRSGALRTGIEVLAPTLTATAAIVSPASAQSILAVVATSLLGFQAAIDKNLLGQQTALLLIGQIDSDLIILGERIRNGLAQDIAIYPFTTAMSDLAQYASAMSVVSALVSMQRAGAANAQRVKDAQAEEAVSNIRARSAQLNAEEAKAKAEEAAQLERAAKSRKAAEESRR